LPRDVSAIGWQTFVRMRSRDWRRQDMAEGKVGKRQIRGFCRLCIARCGTIATVEDGKFVRLDPDPSHPTGSAICAKGRAAPELVYSKARLTRPLRRKSPKGVANPEWEEISWEQAT
jgi:anaerobic selenocysteine-containing dehydrogenase